MKDVTERGDLYLSLCKRPSQRGFARQLDVCPQTLRNVYRGMLPNGRTYRKKEAINRKIENRAFPEVRQYVDIIKKTRRRCQL